MTNEILYVLLDQYAAHEIVYFAQAIVCSDAGVREHPKYVNKIVAPTIEPIRDCSGFRTLPDYSFDTMPQDYAALVLIGGESWKDKTITQQLVPIVQRAIDAGKIVGAICNGASFLAANGFLNAVKHTGNGLDQLKLWGKERYTGEQHYIHQQAVSDKRIVTANGTATLEFAREMLLLLENEAPEKIEMYYQFHKRGYVELFSKNSDN